MVRYKWFKKAITLVLTGFFLLNVVAFIRAYNLTHYSEDKYQTIAPENASLLDELKTFVIGENNPRPKNLKTPSQKFDVIKLKSNKEIECWHIKTKNSKGTVILFHGYSSEKSALLDKSDEFIKQGFSTLLVDFMGSGNSEGNQTTIGNEEAKEVKTVYDYLTQFGETKIFLFGTSMGAVSIMKCINDFEIKPKAIIIECPFGSMYKIVSTTIDKMNLPVFPIAGILLFWGGTQNGFWGFNHDPIEYAKKIYCPTLLLYGEKDDSVSREEIDQIFKNLNGSKTLKIFEETGHENYLLKNKGEWVHHVSKFINTVK